MQPIPADAAADRRAAADAPRSPPSPPSWSPAARSRWAPTRPRTRAASPSCCPPARRSTSITCRAASSPHTLPALIALAEAGLEPVPHVAARRVASRAEVEAFLKQAVRLAGVRKVLLIGGDVAEPLGPYADGAALMRDGLLAGCGVQQVGLPGYPEGHPRIATATLAAALAEKLALAGAQGPRRLRRHAVLVRAQPHRRILRRSRAPRRPTCRSMSACAGPTSPRTLLRYAQRCGVGASLRALQAQGMGAVRLFTHVDPTDQLTALARHMRAGQRQQRRRRAPLQLRRRRHHRPLDERAHHRRARVRGSQSSPSPRPYGERVGGEGPDFAPTSDGIAKPTAAAP